MKKFRITSTSRNLVGDHVEVRVEVSEKHNRIHRIVDVVEIDLSGASRMTEDDLLEEAKKAYDESV